MTGTGDKAKNGLPPERNGKMPRKGEGTSTKLPEKRQQALAVANEGGAYFRDLFAEDGQKATKAHNRRGDTVQPW